MKKIKICLAVLFCTLSAVSVCIISYKYAEDIISYDYKDSKNVSQNSEAVIDIKHDRISVPEEIPYCDVYRMYLENDCLVVDDGENNRIYKSESINTAVFTEEDIKQLERDGFTYTVRSELIEILNYISS